MNKRNIMSMTWKMMTRKQGEKGVMVMVFEPVEGLG